MAALHPPTHPGGRDTGDRFSQLEQSQLQSSCGSVDSVKVGPGDPVNSVAYEFDTAVAPGERCLCSFCLPGPFHHYRGTGASSITGDGDDGESQDSRSDGLFQVKIRIETSAPYVRDRDEESDVPDQ